MPSPSGSSQLDFEFLAGQARAIALDTAAAEQLFLSPEALDAIDTMVEESRDRIVNTWVNLDVWERHVRQVSTAVARVYKSRGEKRITSRQELLATSRSIYSVYPYD